jgi:hypothetical protein
MSVKISEPIMKVDFTHCTHDLTGNEYYFQLTGQCFDCFKDSNHAICINCLNKCHKNHHIVNLRINGSFCDCFDSGKCQCTSK